MSAVDHWRQMIISEHAQTDRIRGPRPSDHWTQLAQNFKDDPHRTGDEMLDELRARVNQGETLIDVGAGGGRLALPLALTCSWVYAVEPSPSMCAVLRETADEHGIENVSVTEATWADASVEPADVVLSSHVVYVIQEIEPFVRKKESNARRLVLAVVFQSPPQAAMGGLWEQVHGEERLRLPSLPEFLPVLEELGIRAEVTELGTRRPAQTFDSLEDARESLTGRLYVKPDTEEMARLERALEDSLEEVDGTWQIRGSQPVRPCIVAWEPSRR